MGYLHHFSSCQEVRPSDHEMDIQSGSKKRKLDELRRNFIREKGFIVFEIRECEWWRLYKTSRILKKMIRVNFP